MYSCVKYDPRHQEARKRRHESLLNDLPDSAVGFLVNRLIAGRVQVHDAAVDQRKQGQRDEALQRDDAHHDANQDADDLPGPVNHIQKVVLLRPFGVWLQCPVPDFLEAAAAGAARFGRFGFVLHGFGGHFFRFSPVWLELNLKQASTSDNDDNILIFMRENKTSNMESNFLSSFC